jgi:hypothetical protein
MAQVGLMVGLAAELQGSGIEVNAVSPVAATRVLRRSAPELTAELVAPGVAFLASSACRTSGRVLGAAGGRFSLGGWEHGSGFDLGPARHRPNGSRIAGARLPRCRFRACNSRD